jgi:glycosyltransferase involved in cell wall biosynthesis
VRVLHVIPSVSVARGGPTEVLVRLARGQAARGASVRVLACRSDLDAAGEARARAALGGVPLDLVATVGPAQLELAPALPGALCARLAEADLVHVHTAFTFPAALPPILCRARSVPHVIRPAGTLDADCIALRSARRKRLAIAAYVRPNLVGADAVQATSEKEAAELRLLAPAARVGVAAPGAAPPSETVPADHRRQGTRIGFLGRLHPSKQLDVLLRAFARLDGEPELLLAGAGDPGYVEGLRALAGTLAIADRTRFLGHLDDADKAAFFARCDLLAFPSLHESFGVAVAEAMAVGRAVVVSPGVALADEIARSGAGVVAPAAPEPFARALADLLDDGAARSRMAEAARRLAADRYSWDAAVERTLALYRDIIDRRRGRPVPRWTRRL